MKDLDMDRIRRKLEVGLDACWPRKAPTPCVQSDD
jgi:hypothetical protein